MIDLVMTINSIQKSSKSELSSRGKRPFKVFSLWLFFPQTVGPAGGLGHEMGFLVQSCHFEEVKTAFGIKHNFVMELEFFASVGDRFGAIRCQEMVGWWRGLREVTSNETKLTKNKTQYFVPKLTKNKTKYFVT